LTTIIFKLSGYGLIRLRIIFIDRKYLEHNYLIVRSGIIGALCISLHRLVDIKMMSGYSSLVDTNFISRLLSSLLKMGVIRIMVVIISHGLRAFVFVCDFSDHG